MAMTPEEKRERNRAYVTKYRLANPEKVIARKKKYYNDNTKKIADQSKEWKAANPEKVVAMRKKYYHINSEKIIERSKRWKATNPEKVIIHDARFLLRLASGVNLSEIPSELVDAKVEQLKITRLIKELSK